MLLKLSTWPCLDIRIRDEVTIKIDNSFFKRVIEFKFLGTTLTNQNSTQEEIKGRFKSGNAAIVRCRIFYLPVCYPKI